MKKIIYFFVLVFTFTGYAINNNALAIDKIVTNTTSSYPSEKSTAIEQKRSFGDLKSKYSGNDFVYKEEKKKKPKKNIDYSFLSGFFNFLKTILPYLLGLLVVFIIIKVIMGNDFSFVNLKRKKSHNTSGIQVDLVNVENIDSNDFISLIKHALKNNNYRLATRYYYLLSLQELTKKGIISYDKDKTNIEYQYEIKNTNMSSDFGYILYLYNYVWYGEFKLDTRKFEQTERNFKNFIKSL